MYSIISIRIEDEIVPVETPPVPDYSDSDEENSPLRNYVWEKDANGNQTDEPVHKWSHGPDAIRYGLYSEFAGREGSGTYTVSFNRK